MGQVTAEVKARVEAKLRECISIAERRFDATFPMPAISYGQKGTTAGVALVQSWTIKLNAVLLMENIDDFIERTVVHEFAHLVDYKLHPENFQTRLVVGRNGRMKRTKRDLHGGTWKHIMIVLGADPSRCHTYDVTNARQKKGRTPGKKFEWTCKTCGKIMPLGPKRHNNMLAGRTRYWMRGCGHHAGYTFNGADERAYTYTKRDEQEAAAKRRMEEFERQQAASGVDGNFKLPTVGQSTGKSNKDLAREQFARCGGSRGAFISLCVSHGIKKTTAGTYWHNFKSGKWS